MTRTQRRDIKTATEKAEWIGEDITAIIKTSQHAHIHRSATDGQVLVFPREMQGTAALITATASKKEDDDTWSDADRRLYGMALRRLRHYKELND